MPDIRDYINLSETASSICDIHTKSADFKSFYENVNELERQSLVRHFIVNNIPFVFKNKPLLYEQSTQYIADKLSISPTEVKLIGSAKTGFSISPPPKYGIDFGIHSDLDFSIVNEELFLKLEYEFNEWKDLFQSQLIKAINENELKYWIENINSVPRQLKNGFIDSHYIPNREQFYMTRRINNSRWLIQKYLDEAHQIKVKKVSVSFYKNWKSFAGRLLRNTKYVMTQL